MSGTRTTLLALAAAAALALGSPAWAVRVAVAPFTPEGEAPASTAWIGPGLAFVLNESLARAQVPYVPLEHLREVYDQEGLVAEPRFAKPSLVSLARQLGSGILVTGRYRLAGEELSVSMEALDLRGDLKRLGRWEVREPVTALLALTEDLGRDLFAVLDTPWPEMPPISPAAFESYVRGRIATDPTVAEVYLRKAVELQPTYDEASCYLALLLRNAGRVTEARSILERIAKRPFSRSAVALAALAGIRLEEGRIAEAWNLYVRSLKAGETPEAHLGLARLYLRQKKYAETLKELRMAETFGVYQEEIELLRSQAQPAPPPAPGASREGAEAEKP
ncbi:MAG: tetratricopeptide repeat protein [Acidobacteriota bacterium]